MQASWISADQLASLTTLVQSAFISPLPGFESLIIAGPDNRKYLQGQVTADLNTLAADNFLRGAHCDAKGKMWAQFHLCAEGDALWYIGFRDELQASATQLKKFGVFSKVSFEAGHDTLAILGISGTGTAALLEQLGYTQPAAAGQLSSVAGGKLLRLADEHYLLILDFAHARQLLAEQSAYLAAPTLWLAQHIQQGFSYLEQAVIGEYVPQMLNLQSIDAISFTKGCYIGQETVARMKYLGKNKRAAYILSSKTEETPASGTDIEVQWSENWRRVGQVINAVNIQGQLWVLAVLPNDINPADPLRLATPDASVLAISPLPYSLA
jgi:folate-binding protein YgfZ